MAQFKTHAYIIRCLTNLHAGSGDANYGVIDKLVQRDQITNYPMIHSSGIKGAIKEYFDKAVSDLSNKIDFFRFVFGSTKTDRNEDMKQGEFKFFDAELLILPVRSNHRPFYRVTSPYILNSIIRKFDNLEVDHDLKVNIEAITVADTLLPTTFENQREIMLEDYSVNPYSITTETSVEASLSQLKEIFGDNLALVNDEEQMRAFSTKLPVIARNYLENGQSGNLWYEEVVPRESLFSLVISYPDNESGNAFFTEFNNKIDGKMVQIGANASIGYGSCKFTLISKLS